MTFNKMKGKAIFITNDNEIQAVIEMNNNMQMNVPVPLPQFDTDDFYFRLKDIAFMFKTIEGNITISIANKMWTLEFDETIWIEIINYLNHD